MREDPVTFTELFMLYRQQFGYSFVACCIALCRHWQLRDSFREIFSDAIMCAFLAFGVSTALDYFGIESEKWGYLASLIIGYVGFKTIMKLITDRIPLINSRSADNVPTEQTKPK